MKIEDTMNGFDVIWDLGRRCTYECTYCPPHRNNKISPLVEFEELKKSMDFLDRYVSIYEEKRGKPYTKRKLSFTGGEPTIHTGFLKFATYIKETYGDKYQIGITTNGLFTRRQAEKYKNFAGTISYHAEGTPEEKKLVIENIKLIKHWQVNVMFHKDYFDECVALCEDLKKEGIKYIPRRIGDDGNDESSIRKGYTHLYTPEQEQYFVNHWRKKEVDSNQKDLDQEYINSMKKSEKSFQDEIDAIQQKPKEAPKKSWPRKEKQAEAAANIGYEAGQKEIEESLGTKEEAKRIAKEKQGENAKNVEIAQEKINAKKVEIVEDEDKTTEVKVPDLGTKKTKPGKTDVYVDEPMYPSLMKDKDLPKRKSTGRMCCGGRDFCVSSAEQPEGRLETYVDNTNFYDYTCLVNHYFLYINQETRDIYHHQTCMVNLDNDVAPIGNLDNSSEIIERLEGYNREKKWPVISCPKTFCGCGMCVDKMDKSFDIKEHNFGITNVELIPNIVKPMERTRTITVRNRMESIDDRLYIENINAR